MKRNIIQPILVFTLVEVVFAPAKENDVLALVQNQNTAPADKILLVVLFRLEAEDLMNAVKKNYFHRLRRAAVSKADHGYVTKTSRRRNPRIRIRREPGQMEDALVTPAGLPACTTPHIKGWYRHHPRSTRPKCNRLQNFREAHPELAGRDLGYSNQKIQRTNPPPYPAPNNGGGSSSGNNINNQWQGSTQKPYAYNNGGSSSGNNINNQWQGSTQKPYAYNNGGSSSSNINNQWQGSTQKPYAYNNGGSSSGNNINQWQGSTQKPYAYNNGGSSSGNNINQWQATTQKPYAYNNGGSSSGNNINQWQATTQKPYIPPTTNNQGGRAFSNVEIEGSQNKLPPNFGSRNKGGGGGTSASSNVQSNTLPGNPVSLEPTTMAANGPQNNTQGDTPI